VDLSVAGHLAPIPVVPDRLMDQATQSGKNAVAHETRNETPVAH
jgi:hypothetical protein